jgi:hypothetical protein
MNLRDRIEKTIEDCISPEYYVSQEVIDNMVNRILYIISSSKWKIEIE